MYIIWYIPFYNFQYVSEFHTHKLAPRAVAFATFQQNALHVFLSIPAMFIVPMDWYGHIFNIDFKPWRLYIICNSLVNLFNGIVFAALPESPKFLLITNQKEKALGVLRRAYAFNTGQSQEVNMTRMTSIIRNNTNKSKIFFTELSSQTYKDWHDRKHTGRNTWILQYFAIAVVTNETNLLIAVADTHVESELHYICDVYDWTWDIHVVSWKKEDFVTFGGCLVKLFTTWYLCILCDISKGFQISLFNYKTTMDHRKRFVRLSSRNENLLEMGKKTIFQCFIVFWWIIFF